jgi:SAM-dependent methyltransferase
MTAAAVDGGRSFDAWAGDYDRYRPGYPDALFDEIAARLQLPERPLVADLGAGTGRATLAMAERGWRVTAIEPGGPMLDVLRARATDAGLLVATFRAEAEETSLDPASVDLVTVAQAFHWFDQTRAVAEMARVVRPGGGIALFWNTRDAASSPLVAAYERLLDQHGADRSTRGPGRHPDTRRWIAERGAFDEPDFIQVRHVVPMAPSAFIGLAFTASYVRALAPDALQRFRVDLEELVAEHAPPSELIEIPYVVDCEIARRRAP